MPRGGARTGAGRKKGLSSIEIEMAQNLFNNLRREAELMEADRKLFESVAPETRQIWCALSDIPVSERTKWLGTYEAQEIVETQYFFRRERDNIDDTDDSDGSRLHEIEVRRIYNGRDELIDETAACLSLVLDRPISASQIRKALKVSLKTDPI